MVRPAKFLLPLLLYFALKGFVQRGLGGGTPPKALSPDESPKAARRGNGQFAQNLMALSIIILNSQLLFGQFGAKASYLSMNAPNWGDYYKGELGENPYPQAGWKFGFDYWFRLKNIRVEFLSEASYGKHEYLFDQGWVRSNFYSLALNVNLYPFDLAGDCDCPTWSKDGDFFSKGFFIQASPGLSLLTNKFTKEPISINNDEGFAFFIGAGVGLDIGLSDVFTITPLASISYAPAVEWWDTTGGIRSSIVLTGVGVRLGFTLDE